MQSQTSDVESTTITSSTASAPVSSLKVIKKVLKRNNLDLFLVSERCKIFCVQLYTIITLDHDNIFLSYSYFSLIIYTNILILNFTAIIYKKHFTYGLEPPIHE